MEGKLWNELRAVTFDSLHEREPDQVPDIRLRENCLAAVIRLLRLQEQEYQLLLRQGKRKLILSYFHNSSTPRLLLSPTFDLIDANAEFFQLPIFRKRLTVADEFNVLCLFNHNVFPSLTQLMNQVQAGHVMQVKMVLTTSAYSSSRPDRLILESTWYPTKTYLSLVVTRFEAGGNTSVKPYFYSNEIRFVVVELEFELLT